MPIACSSAALALPLGSTTLPRLADAAITSLYIRFGGWPPISTVVENFFNKVCGDNRINSNQMPYVRAVAARFGTIGGMLRAGAPL